MSDAEFMLEDARERLRKLHIFASKNTRKKLKKEIRAWEYDVARERTAQDAEESSE